MIKQGMYIENMYDIKLNDILEKFVSSEHNLEKIKDLYYANPQFHTMIHCILNNTSIAPYIVELIITTTNQQKVLENILLTGKTL